LLQKMETAKVTLRKPNLVLALSAHQNIPVIGIHGARGHRAPLNASVKESVPVPETAPANLTSKTPVDHQKTLRNAKSAAPFNVKKTAMTMPHRQPPEMTILAVVTPHQPTATTEQTILITVTT